MKEEINDIQTLEIDINDVDELALWLEVCAKKSNMVIEEFSKLIIKLQQENKQLKDNWNKLREWIVYHKHNENTKEHYLVVDYGTLLGKMQELEGDNND